MSVTDTIVEEIMFELETEAKSSGEPQTGFSREIIGSIVTESFIMQIIDEVETKLKEKGIEVGP